MTRQLTPKSTLNLTLTIYCSSFSKCVWTAQACTDRIWAHPRASQNIHKNSTEKQHWKQPYKNIHFPWKYHRSDVKIAANVWVRNGRGRLGAPGPACFSLWCQKMIPMCSQRASRTPKCSQSAPKFPQELQIIQKVITTVPRNPESDFNSATSFVTWPGGLREAL